MRTTLSSLLLLAALSATAQPVLTTATRPQAGDECIYGDSNDPFPFAIQSGPDQFWDLSGMTFTYDHTMSYVAANTAPGHTHFPAAEVAWTPDGDYYEFSDYTSTQWKIIGAYTQSLDEWILTPDPIIYMNYPCTYGMQWSDPYSYIASNDPTEYYDTLTMNAVAYGTVLLPGGTVAANVLGFVETHSETFVDTLFGDVYFSNWSRLQLFSPWSRCKLADLTYDEEWFNGSVTYLWSGELLDDPSIGMEEASAEPAPELWPVPASDVLDLRWPGAHEDLQVQLFDAIGRATPTPIVSNTGEVNSIDVSGLPPGTYLLRATDAAGRTLAQRFTVER